MSLLTWKLHGDGKSISQGEVVSTDERLTWPRTIGGSSAYCCDVWCNLSSSQSSPASHQRPRSSSLALEPFFLALTQNKVPSYLGSSFAFLAPIAAARAAVDVVRLGGVVVTGLILAGVGLIVRQAGIDWINWMLPPIVTGTIVMVIGLNRQVRQK